MKRSNIFVVIVVLSVLFLEIHGSPEKRLKRCEKKCYTDMNTCSMECRMKNFKNMKRKVIVNCLIECQKEYEECRSECSCSTNCAINIIACKESCDLKYTDKKDNRQCKRSCRGDANQCRNNCWLLSQCRTWLDGFIYENQRLIDCWKV